MKQHSPLMKLSLVVCLLLFITFEIKKDCIIPSSDCSVSSLVKYISCCSGDIKNANEQECCDYNNSCDCDCLCCVNNIIAINQGHFLFLQFEKSEQTSFIQNLSTFSIKPLIPPPRNS